MNCLLCKQECKSIKSLSAHIVSFHKIKLSEYYKKYIDNTNNTCLVCGKETSFISLTKGFHRFCCCSCANSYNIKKWWKLNYTTDNIEKRIVKSKQTKLERYGDENYVNREKTIQTLIERYGDKNYNNRAKAAETNYRLYGSSSYTETDEFKEKSKQTKLERHGDAHFVNKEKAAKTILKRYGKKHIAMVDEFKEKSKQTKLERYGDENYNNRSKAYKTCIERYNNPIPQNKKYFYDNLYFDSKWEIYYYAYLKKYNINFTYHPKPLKYEFKNIIHSYFPDFLVDGTYVEIKNDYLFNNLLIEGTVDNAKYKCMIKNNVKIILENDLKDIIDEMKNEVNIDENYK